MTYFRIMYVKTFTHFMLQISITVSINKVSNSIIKYLGTLTEFYTIEDH